MVGSEDETIMRGDEVQDLRISVRLCGECEFRKQRYLMPS
jgi:hypothetical protein